MPVFWVCRDNTWVYMHNVLDPGICSPADNTSGLSDLNSLPGRVWSVLHGPMMHIFITDEPAGHSWHIIWRLDKDDANDDEPRASFRNLAFPALYGVIWRGYIMVLSAHTWLDMTTRSIVLCPTMSATMKANDRQNDEQSSGILSKGHVCAGWYHVCDHVRARNGHMRSRHMEVRDNDSIHAPAASISQAW